MERAAGPLNGPTAPRGVAAAALFLFGPLVLLTLAVGLRASGRVTSGRTVAARVMALRPLASETSKTEGVPLPLLLAVVSAESGGRVGARSGAGAIGLMQLMPATAAELAASRDESPPDLRDPRTSLRLGARYLARQLARHEGRERARELALASYNAGPAAVDRWLREKPPPPGSEAFLAWIPYAETRAFVRRVTRWERRWRAVAAAPIESPR